MIHKVPSRTSKFGILFSTCMSEVGRKIGDQEKEGGGEEEEEAYGGWGSGRGTGAEKRIGQSDKQ